jgi:hypothetical protein
MLHLETRKDRSSTKERPGRFLMALGAFTAVAMAALWQGNKLFAPEMYSRAGSVEIAEAFAKGRNYAVFDLNINIRELRDEHIKRMSATPDVVILGASHWQEAHDWIVQHKRLYNAHVHRDYYEDMLAMVEMFVRHDRLPKQMIIAIRDNLFTPVAQRKDHLWLPGVPYYEAMAKRLGITAHRPWETAPYQRWAELASLPMFHANATRWTNATFRPRRTFEAEHSRLDTLLPGGSIIWSHEHQALFTQKRTREMSDDFARQRINQPPVIDPKGVEHMDRLLQFLKDKGVEVFLAHPPFNPDYYNQVMKGPYAKGLRAVEALTQTFADKYGWQVVGSFDPAKVGCDSPMFIDAEHGSPECLAKLLHQYVKLDLEDEAPGTHGAPVIVSDAKTAGQSVRHRIAVAVAQPPVLQHNETATPEAASTPDQSPVAVPQIVIRPRTADEASASAASTAKQTVAKPAAAAVAPAPLSTLTPAQEVKVKLAQKAPAKATVRYPFVTKTKTAKATTTTCTPYVWPGDHAYPDRVKNACRYRTNELRGG